jgi:hypothetical protein
MEERKVGGQREEPELEYFFTTMTTRHMSPVKDRDMSVPSFTAEERAELDERIKSFESSNSGFANLSPVQQALSRDVLMAKLEILEKEPSIGFLASPTEIYDIRNHLIELHVSGKLLIPEIPKP